jgi:hypothetical protein
MSALNEAVEAPGARASLVSAERRAEVGQKGFRLGVTVEDLRHQQPVVDDVLDRRRVPHKRELGQRRNQVLHGREVARD